MEKLKENEPNTITSVEEKETQSLNSNLKPTGLPMDDTSDAWMDDDVGTFDSGSESELEEAHSSDHKNHIEQHPLKTYVLFTKR